MFKPVLGLAIPAIVLGFGLAQTTPQDRAHYVAAVGGALGLATEPTESGPSRVAAATPVPPSHPSLGPDATTIEPDRLGQYDTTMLIAGRSIPAMVDTGASYVALRAEDAASIGIHPSASDFVLAVRTANGVARAAPAVIPRIRVGNVEAYNVQAIVSQPGALASQNLLGMSFLRKLGGFRVEGGRLILTQ